MLAIALDDFTLNVLDMETQRIVRKFSGHRGQVNDMVRGAHRMYRPCALAIPQCDLGNGPSDS